MKRVFVLVLAVLLLPGCTYLMPFTNQPPMAYIDDISPTEADEGDEVSFRGHGTDADGDVVAYRWRSTLDGQLSTVPEFETDDLSVGTHVIYFQVQDNNGAWSSEVRGNVEIESGPTAPARINSFTVADTIIEAGQDTTLSWNVSNADEISINQGIGDVPSVGSTTISPSDTTIYILTAEGGGSVATSQLTVSVEDAELEIIFFEADDDEIPSGGEVTLSWETAGANRVTLNGLIVESSGSREFSPTGETVHTYTLVAMDDDDTVVEEVEVETYLAEPEMHTVALEPVLEESGYVRSNGQAWDEFIYVGDDSNDLSIQAFLSFDISDIPEDAEIESVVVDFSDHDSTYGDPFGDLGCLRAYPDDYGSLSGGDYFDGNPTGAISRWCDIEQLEDADEDDDWIEALEDVLGDDWLQIRLQFDEEETDFDGNNDLVRFTSGHLPRLIIEYTAVD